MSQNQNIVSEDGCVTAPSVEFGTIIDAGAPGYWKALLADVPGLELPTDRMRPAVLGQSMALESVSLPADLISGLRRLSAEAGVELSTVTLAAF